MRIDVVGRQFEVTDAIREYAESKIEKLPKFFDGTQLVTCTISKPDHDRVYRVELVVDVEKHENFVSHTDGEDVYGAIDATVSKSRRQLTDYKEKLKQGKRG
ncbi:MAG: ribosome-associated translation inhibitor RaiA [Phycisphaeraceae bacterium]|nr:ribosome-associated translation inhibitor RaiA [Phycisphaeraceae bacterium]MCW5764157.1 ribosome-associated translation inhibitor RaiA [Phycisphaeraceae bacterium]